MTHSKNTDGTLTILSAFCLLVYLTGQTGDIYLAADIIKRKTVCEQFV